MRVWLGLAAAVTAVGVFCSGARAAPPLDAYGKLPALDDVVLSPKGDRVAFVAQAGDQRKLLVATVAGKLLTQAQIQTKVRGLRWAGEDHVLVTTSATVDFTASAGFKDELESVLDIDVNTSKSIVLFKHDIGIAPLMIDGQFGDRFIGGQWRGYFGAFNEGQRSWDLYAVDLATGEPKLAAHGAPDIETWLLSSTGTVLALTRYDQRNSHWKLVAGGSEKVLVDRVSPQNNVELAGLGRTPDTVLVRDDTGDRSTLDEVSLKDGHVTPLLFQDVTLEGEIHDPETRLLIGVYLREEPRAFFFDPKLQERYLKLKEAFPGRALGLVSWTSNLDQVIVETEGTGDSGTYWFVDLATLKAHALGFAHPEIKPEDVGPVSVVEYKAADGLAMDGILTLPPGRAPKNLPLVVMPHGGPIGIDDEVGFDWWAQAFASRGYAVFQPNYRGSGGHGPAFRQAGYGEWGRKMLSDMRDGVDALAAKGIVDPKRECIVGASYGGYAALAGVTLQHGYYRCAVSVAGPSDLSTMLRWERERSGDVNAAWRYWQAAMGVDKGGGQVLPAISPVTYVKIADAPILMIHGKDDTVVPIDQSIEMNAALQKAGKPVEFIQIAGGDHWELHDDARQKTTAESVAWVLKYNPPD